MAVLFCRVFVKHCTVAISGCSKLKLDLEAPGFAAKPALGNEGELFCSSPSNQKPVHIS
jgi:hypothetical protein